MAVVSANTNLSSVSYAAGEAITINNGAVLTVDSTPSVLPGSIICITSGKLRIENSSTTVPIRFPLSDMNRDFRFEANGVLEVRGQMMEVGTGTGAAQTFNLGTLYSGVIDDLTYVEVETAAGSGVYRPWPIIPIDPIFYNAGRTDGGRAVADFVGTPWEAGKVAFWHYRNREMSFGNNTNGWSVPNGCKIRIPNILITNAYATDATLVHAIASEGTPTGGTFTITITNRATGTVLGTTAAIAFNATAAAIDTAIEAITGAGTVTSGGGALPTTVSITWAGSLASTPLALTVNSSVTGGTNSVIYTRENSTANLTLIDLNPSGAMDCENCMFSQKIRIVNDAFSSARLIRVGFGSDVLQFNNSNGAVTIENVSVCVSPYVVGSNFQIASVLGNVSIDGLAFSSRRSNSRIVLSAIPGLSKFDNVTNLGYASPVRFAANRDSINIGTVAPDIPFNNIVGVGGRILGTNLIGNTWNNPKVSDGSQSTQSSVNAVSAFQFVNCVNQKILAPSMAGPMAPRNYFVTADINSLNIEVFGGVFDGGNNTLGLVNPNGKTTRFLNTTCANVRSGPFLDQPATFTASGIEMKKVFATFATAQIAAGFDVAQDAVFDLAPSTIVGINEAFASVENYVGGNFADPSLTPTTGHVTFGPFGRGNGYIPNGSTFTNQSGGVLLPTTGDFAEFIIPFAMHGVTSFQNVAPIIHADIPGAAANSGTVIAPGIPTGGTFTITIANAAGTVLGTTSAIAFNASAATVDAAMEAVAGIGTGQVTVSGTSIGAGYLFTFSGTLAGVSMIVSVDGTNLTGGAEPGVAYAVGRLRLQDGTEGLNLAALEFAVRRPGTDFSAYQALSGANLASALSSLSGYDPAEGFEMALRITAGNTNPLTQYNQISLRTNIDPTLWTVTDASIVINGPNPTDVTKVVRASDSTVLYTFTGSANHAFNIGSNYATEVLFVRENSAGEVLARTTVTRKLDVGVNPVLNLFAGDQVQLAQSGQLSALDALIRERLDVAVSSRTTADGVWTAPSRTLNGALFT